MIYQSIPVVPVGPAALDRTDQHDATRQIMLRLRFETRAAHLRIESNPRLAALLKPGLTDGQYQDVLLRYHAYFARIEPDMFATLSSIVPAEEFDRRRKLPLLQSDLAACGLAAQTAQPDPSEGGASCAQALGRLYVHEGASLGGRLIHAALRRDVGHGRPCAFFAGYGSETAEVWRRTQAILGAGLAGDAEISEAAEAANAAFDEIDRIMA